MTDELTNSASPGRRNAAAAGSIAAVGSAASSQDSAHASIQPSADPPLYRMDPTGRFSDRAEAYRKHRPTYPSEAIDALLAGMGEPSRLVAADIGAGTGISSRLLAERGVRVLAIEPNAAMRDVADPHPNVEVRDGLAEKTSLPDGSVDLVVAAQAFHWFDPEPTLREFYRILRPKGRLAVIWNERDLTDPATAVYSDIVQRAARRSAEESWHLRPEELYSSRLFVAAWEQMFPAHQPLDAAGFIGRALSASYVPKSGPEFELMVRELRAAHERFRGADGHVPLAYRTILYLSEPIARGA